MNISNTFCLGLLSLTLTAGYASAATFAEADTDRDGFLSLAEAKAAGLDDVVKNFKKLDTNGDGKLSKEELKNNR